MTTISKIITLLRNPRIFRTLVSFYWNGYLSQIGWIESFRNQRPVNEKNEPIPWVTYSFIDFVTSRLNKHQTVLEFGSGYSTLFYCKHVKQVYAVEHDMEWYREILKTRPTNANITHVALDYGGYYAAFASSLNLTFDIIIVDGRDRVNCLKQSVNCLSATGVMVLDDSERAEYLEGLNFLIERGFKKIDFWGIAPGIFFKKCTTLFYKENNCVGV